LTKNKRFKCRIKELVRRLSSGSKEKEDLTGRRFGDWAKAKLHGMVTEFFQAAPCPDPNISALHKFRIRGKQLRYGMELLAGAFPPTLREQLYPMVEELQEKLGEINDRATARRRFQQRIDAAQDAVDAEQWSALLKREEARLEEARRAFLQWWNLGREAQLRAGFDQYLADGFERAPAIERIDRLVSTGPSAQRQNRHPHIRLHGFRPAS
jgi:CHAD domain-containing protein